MPLRLLYRAALFAGVLMGAAPRGSAATAAAAPAVQMIGDTIVDPAALTIDGVYGQCINGQSFQQDALTTFNGWQYVTWYDQQRHVCLARRQLPARQWQFIRFSDYDFRGDDAHNVISLGICPADGTIHLAFDHHINPLHYRVSQKGAALLPEQAVWSMELFTPVINRLAGAMDRVTYPAFVATPDGNLQLHYRAGTSGAGQRWVVDYDAAAATWRNNRQIDTGDGTFRDQFNESKNRNAYPNSFNFDSHGRLHYTWVWRENTQGANHDLCYAYSDDRGMNWRNNGGDVVKGGDGKELIRIDSPGITVVPLDRSRSLMNQQAQTVDSRGRVHVLLWHARDDYRYAKQWWVPTQCSYFHYWRDEQGRWQRREIRSEVGNRPKLFCAADDTLYAVFTVNRDPTKWSHDIYYTDGELRIASASATGGWSDWKVVYRGTGHYLNEALGDAVRFKTEGVLSVIAQDTPAAPRQSTALRVLDFKLGVAGGP